MEEENVENFEKEQEQVEAPALESTSVASVSVDPVSVDPVSVDPVSVDSVSVATTIAAAPKAKAAKEPVVEEEDDEPGPGGLKRLDSQRDNLPWYVVHTYSGFEARVKLTLEERIRNEGAVAKFGHIVVPVENVVELVRGEKKASTRKFFPGYILVQCKLDEQTWHIVTATPKVTGFVGDALNPSPLSPEEVANLLQQMEGKGPKSRASIEFQQGDAVKVVDGPFADFNGTVDDVKPDKGKLRVLISIFGRNTPVELDFVQVEKV